MCAPPPHQQCVCPPPPLPLDYPLWILPRVSSSSGSASELPPFGEVDVRQGAARSPLVEVSSVETGEGVQVSKSRVVASFITKYKTKD